MSGLTLKTEISPGVFTVKVFTRDAVASDKDAIYIFGDNTNDRVNTKYIPSMTQALIRGLPNAQGIDTKRDRGWRTSSYFTEKNLAIYQRYVDKVIQRLKEHLNNGETLVFPEDGVGSGNALLKVKSPLLFGYLSEQLYLNFGFINDGYIPPDGEKGE